MTEKTESIICLPHLWGKEYYITARSAGKTREILEQLEATPLVSQRVGIEQEEAADLVPCPMTSLTFPAAKGGLTTWAVSGLDVKTIEIDGEVIGRLFEDDNGVYLRCGGVKPEAQLPPGKEAARQVFSKLNLALEKGQMDFSNVVRTWFFNDDILSWYDDFNAIRTAFFEEAGVFDGLLPASTGIGAPNPFGAPMMTGLLAMKAKNEDTWARAVKSPLQCSPRDYGSSFSRAAVIHTPEYDKLFISGTASVAPEGHTAYVNDLEKQIDLTFQVVKAILGECQWTFHM